MTPPFPGFCPQCNSPVQAGQRFCHDCGASLSQDANASTSRPDSTVVKQNGASAPPWVPAQNVIAGGSSVPAPGYPFPLSQVQENLIPPPPPPPPSSLFPPISSSPYEGTSAPGAPTTPVAAKSSGKGRASGPALPKRSGRGRVSAFLLLVLVLGSIGIWFAFFRPHGTSTGNQGRNGTNGQGSLNTGSTPSGNSNTPDSTNANTPSGSSNTPSSNGSPVGSGSVTEQVNLKFTYASIEYAVTSLQQANGFPDDSSATEGSVIRISLNENNPTSNNPGFAYNNVAHLVLPDGTITPVTNSQYRYAPDAATQHANWIDFAVPSPNLDLGKLVLRMGLATENQMDISLMPNADLSKYQPKTVTPNSAFQYAGLHFTITKVVESLSADSQQAATGQILIVVTMKVVNSTSNGFFNPAGNYMRLKAGDTTSPPTNNAYFTFPRDLASQSTGTGYVVFPMPQGSTSFILTMLGQSSNAEVSVPFQIP
jgi:hypothetical protein